MPRKSTRRIPKQKTTVSLKMPAEAAASKSPSKDSNPARMTRKERRIVAEQRIERHEKLVDEAIERVLRQSQGDSNIESSDADSDVNLSANCINAVSKVNNDYTANISNNHPEGRDFVSESNQPLCSGPKMLTRKQTQTLKTKYYESPVIKQLNKSIKSEKRACDNTSEVKSATGSPSAVVH
jgi:hypothetical protein